MTQRRTFAAALLVVLGCGCAPRLDFIGKRCDDGVCPQGLLCDAAGVCVLTECDAPHGLGAACAVGTGPCRRAGEQICEDRRLVCSAQAGEPGLEQCNGVDDDCDGVVDDLPGCVTTLAGSGPPGFVDGPPDAGQYARPLFIKLSPDGGALYVADSFNHAIRRVEPSGRVSTVAGLGRCGFQDGPVDAALFCEPYDVEPGRNDVLYVADRLNHRIRKIENGVVTTLAGGGTAGFADGYGTAALFNRPQGLELLANGDLLIADAQNDRIRRWVASTGWVRTEAGPAFLFPLDAGLPDGGTADAGFLDVPELQEPADVRECCGGGRVLVSEASGNRIRSIPLDGGVPLVLAGDPDGGRGNSTGAGVPTNARLDRPLQLELSGSTVYIADSRNHRVAQFAVQSGGVASTGFGITAGSGVRGFEIGFSTAARFDTPVGLSRFLDQLIVSDQNHRLRAIPIFDSQRTVNDFSGGPHAERLGVEGDLVRLRGPRAPFALSEDRVAWIEPELNLARSYSPDGGMRGLVGDLSLFTQPPIDGTLSSARLFAPEDAVPGPDGRLYLADLSSHSVRAVDLDAGTVSTFAGDILKLGFCCDGGTLPSSQLNSPAGVAFGQSDAGFPVLYISDRGNFAIRKVLFSTLRIYFYAGGQRGTDDGAPGKFTEVGPITVAEDGRVYVADLVNGASRIRRITELPNGSGTVSTPFALPFAVTGLAASGPGKLIAVGGPRILELSTQDGGVRTLYDGTANPGIRDGTFDTAQFWDVAGVRVLPDALIFSDRGAQRIRRLWTGPER